MWAAAAGLSLALAGHACTATNFLDPEGPRYYETRDSAKRDDAAAAGAGAPLRIVTFNLEYGREIEGALRLIRDSDALRSPDLLLLQEMSGEGVVRIAAGLGLNYLAFPSGIHPQAHQEYGTAILSPWPIEEPDKLMLPHGAAITGMRRAVTIATVRWRGGPIRVYSVHLPGPLSISAEERREQVQLIIDAARGDEGLVIVAGDFNSGVVGPWFEQDRFTWVTAAVRGTAHRFGHRFPFDYVFAKGLGPAGDGSTAGCVEARGVSDHCAVWVMLAPQPPRPSPAR
jgi:endonuclease/exonuclease/phosphatase family metal-dependent hydrolase